MPDNAFWIASLTAGTAVLASWVTSRGTARAARIQADTTTRAQRVERLRETRRTAYANLIEQAQRMGDLYWKVSDLCADDITQAPGELRQLRDRLRDEYSGLRHCTWIVSLEGPPEVAEAADALRRTTTPSYRAVEAMLDGDREAAERFDAAYAPFWQALRDFVERAREALRVM
ncbi:hypothetical protein ACFOZ0_25380 [Streptomyces yaanensis]|uniref:Secreted protein n=1 Tax=Streptomyces yaanensis TaxID=1142239 RepID=A0ABV7SIR6_9ACTN|nr:hypothetical protein [Streptomyces sp. CGMCC 4.7035]WNC01522.1 hypothetical protein Q2K21_27585 [Streptomyces sp. CGMCC 4.7035]